MKLRISLTGLVIVLFCVCNLNAQIFIPGIKIGLNAGSFQSEQIESSSRIGIEAGINLTAQLGDKLDIITELAYTQKGVIAQGRPYSFTSSSSNLAATPQDYNVFINSYTWGAMANYYIKAPNLSLQAGPVLGFNRIPDLMQEEVSFGNNEDNQMNINSMDLNEALSDGIDYALAFGISGGTEALRVNLRYHLGLKDYLKKTEYNDLGYTLKSNYVQLSVSYSFLNMTASR